MSTSCGETDSIDRRNGHRARGGAAQILPRGAFFSHWRYGSRPTAFTLGLRTGLVLTRDAANIACVSSRHRAVRGQPRRRLRNALAESVIGLYKTEVIRRRGPWRTLEAVEFATLEWVDWFNMRRLLGPIGDVPPAEFEAKSL